MDESPNESTGSASNRREGPRTIAVLGATGRTGQRVVEYALAAGHSVRALARSPEAIAAIAAIAAMAHPLLTVLRGDANVATDVAHLLDGADAVISTVGGGTLEDPGGARSRSARNIVAALGARNDTATRAVIVAGAGILDAESGGLRQDQPGFPAIYFPVSDEHRRTWETVRDSDIAWTMVCAGDIVAGERTGAYRALAERMPEGGSRISIDDLAAFLLEQLTDERFVRRRVSLVY